MSTAGRRHFVGHASSKPTIATPHPVIIRPPCLQTSQAEEWHSTWADQVRTAARQPQPGRMPLPGLHCMSAAVLVQPCLICPAGSICCVTHLMCSFHGCSLSNRSASHPLNSPSPSRPSCLAVPFRSALWPPTRPSCARPAPLAGPRGWQRRCGTWSAWRGIWSRALPATEALHTSGRHCPCRPVRQLPVVQAGQLVSSLASTPTLTVQPGQPLSPLSSIPYDTQGGLASAAG